MLDAYLYTGRRSPFGRHAGALARLRPDDMLASVIAQVVADSGFAPEEIEDVVVGCGNQAGEDSRCVARHAALVAGLPVEVPGSGMPGPAAPTSPARPAAAPRATPRSSPVCRSRSLAPCCSAIAAPGSTRSRWRRRPSPAARVMCSSRAVLKA